MWYYEYPPTEQVEFFPYYLHSIGLHDLQPLVVKPEGDPYHQFFYSVHGDGKLILNQNSFYIPEHSAFFVPAHIKHEYYPLSDVWDVRWMVPAGNALDELIRFLGMENGGVYTMSHHHPLDIILNKMHSELINDSVDGNIYASSYVQEFILEFARQAGMIQPSVAKKEKDSVDIYQKNKIKIMDYVKYHYMHQINIDELCDLINVTPQHLCRITKRTMGMRPMEYINTVRVSAAKVFLENTEHSISDISEWCGFENQNYFWKTFKKLESMTPGEYRKLHTIEAK